MTQEARIQYPKTAIVIIAHQFANYFVCVGLRNAIISYVSSNFHFSEADIEPIYHLVFCLAHTLTVIGALLTDSYWGKYTVLQLLSIFIVLGSVFVAMKAFDNSSLALIVFGFIGLALVALGVCGVLAIGLAFGCEQFTMPQHQEQLVNYFSIFYFWITFSAVLAIILVPLMIDAALWIAFVCFIGLMVVATGFFMCFLGKYNITHGKNNLFKIIPMTIYNGVSNWRRERKKERRPHWLDYVDPSVDKQTVNHIKVLLGIMLLFFPLTMFSAVKIYQPSSWTSQAMHMDDSLGYFDIKPYHMQLTNHFMVLLLVPLFNLYIYKFLFYLDIRRPLQKIALGGILAVASLLCSVSLQAWLESYVPAPLSAGKSQLRIINGENCQYAFTTNIPGKNEFILSPVQMFVDTEIPTKDGTFSFQYNITGMNCPNLKNGTQILKEASASTLFLGSKLNSTTSWYKEYVIKPPNRRSLVRTLMNLEEGKQVKYKALKTRHAMNVKEIRNIELYDIQKGYYNVLVNKVVLSSIYIGRNGVYAVIVNNKSATLIEVVYSDSIHMSWQIPQYFFISTAEVLVCINGLEYSFTEAPASMTSLFLALWFGSSGIGHLTVGLVFYVDILKQKSLIDLMFALILLFAMGLFAFLSARYTPSNSFNR